MQKTLACKYYLDAWCDVGPLLPRVAALRHPAKPTRFHAEHAADHHAAPRRETSLPVRRKGARPR